MSLTKTRVLILGLGLMGGSLALALRGKCARVAGYDRDPDTVRRATRRRVVDLGVDDLVPGSCKADLVVLATPVGEILRLLPRIGDLLPDPFHLLDLGSTKVEIVRAMSGLPEHVRPIGGHPMCGREVSGLEAADGDLFREQPFVLTPLDRTPRETLDLATEVVRAIGSRPVPLPPELHDRVAASISHVPYVVAAALAEAARAPDEETARALASSGFRDATRVAASPAGLMLDVIRSNRAFVLEGLSRFETSLRRLAGLIERGEEENLRGALETARSWRREFSR